MGSQSELWIKFPTTWWCQVPTLTIKSQSHGVIPCSTGDPAASNYRCIPNISPSVNLLTRSHTKRIDHHILLVYKDILLYIHNIYIYIDTPITYLSIGHFVGVYGMKHCESNSFGWWFQFHFHVRPECLWDGTLMNNPINQPLGVILHHPKHGYTVYPIILYIYIYVYIGDGLLLGLPHYGD